MMRALLGLVLALIAAHAEAAPVGVSGGWFRLLPGGLPAGGYFTLHNGSARTILLAGARSRACGAIMLHRSRAEGGMAMMEDTASVPVAPGRDLVFAPGSYHLMCMNPAMSLGMRVPVTLVFGGGLAVDTVFTVRGATGK